jgi:hypothetical protein
VNQKSNSTKHSFGYFESDTLPSPKRTLHTVALWYMMTRPKIRLHITLQIPQLKAIEFKKINKA